MEQAFMVHRFFATLFWPFAKFVYRSYQEERKA